VEFKCRRTIEDRHHREVGVLKWVIADEGIWARQAGDSVPGRGERADKGSGRQQHGLQKLGVLSLT
jgi:hypothetical protein